MNYNIVKFLYQLTKPAVMMNTFVIIDELTTMITRKFFLITYFILESQQLLLQFLKTIIHTSITK